MVDFRYRFRWQRVRRRRAAPVERTAHEGEARCELHGDEALHEPLEVVLLRRLGATRSGRGRGRGERRHRHESRRRGDHEPPSAIRACRPAHHCPRFCGRDAVSAVGRVQSAFNECTTERARAQRAIRSVPRRCDRLVERERPPLVARGCALVRIERGVGELRRCLDQRPLAGREDEAELLASSLPQRVAARRDVRRRGGRPPRPAPRCRRRRVVGRRSERGFERVRTCCSASSSSPSSSASPPRFSRRSAIA